MEKISLPVKIISWIIIISLSLISIYFLGLLCGVKDKGMGAAFAAVFYFGMFVIILSVPALFITLLFTHWVGKKAAIGTYWPGDKVELLPSDYSEIRSNIVKGDYYKAIDKLEEMIRTKPDNHIAVALLSDIYVDHIEKYGKAIAVLSDFLNRPERSERDIPFVMKLTDVILEINEDEKAIRLLERELTLSYDDKGKEILRKRMEGIEK